MTAAVAVRRAKGNGAATTATDLGCANGDTAVRGGRFIMF